MAMSSNLRHIPDGAEVTVTQPSLWSCLQSEMNVPTSVSLGPSCLPGLKPAQGHRPRPWGPASGPWQAELSVLVDVLHRPELLFPENTDARRKWKGASSASKQPSPPRCSLGQNPTTRRSAGSQGRRGLAWCLMKTARSSTGGLFRLF